MNRVHEIPRTNDCRSIVGVYDQLHYWILASIHTPAHRCRCTSAISITLKNLEIKATGIDFLAQI